METDTNEAIKTYIKNHNKISVVELAKFFDMDKDTIRAMWRRIFIQKGLDPKTSSVKYTPEFYEQVQVLKNRLKNDIT
jgi:lipoprotein NlpI